ncbi:MAG: FecR domain-containing protein [Leptolyngbyaceae cyanobacterium]
MNHLFLKSLFGFTSLTGLVSASALTIGHLPAHAEVPLTRADVESVYNRVELIPEGETARRANLTDWLARGDALRTFENARAELRFNDGSLARVGERATFWFVPNTRDFRLSNGTALFLIPPGQGPSNIQTPSAVTGIQGTALVVRHIPRQDCVQAAPPAEIANCPGRTVVMVLTDSPKGPVEVSTETGRSVALNAGNLAVIENDAIQVLEFDLRLFYETSPLVEGLDLDNPDYVGTGSPTDPVRQETWAGIQTQEGFESSYLLNPELISVDAQLGVSTSWLLSPSDTPSGFPVSMMSGDRVGNLDNFNQGPSRRSANRALMSSWFANTPPSALPSQANVPPGILATPSGASQPAGATPTTQMGSRVPTTNSGTPAPFVPPTPTSGPSVIGGGSANPPTTTPSTPTQQPFDPVGQPTTPDIPVGGEPTVPDATGGAPTQPTPFDPTGGTGGIPQDPTDLPMEQPVINPNDGFEPPGNNDPTGNPDFTPPGNPTQPQGVPFDPTGGGAAPAPNTDPGVGAAGGVTAPVPTVEPILNDVQTVPDAAAANDVPAGVIVEQPTDPTPTVETQTVETEATVN